nr:uncharacterized protein LOC110567110 [Aotus nancymaae]
MPAAGLSHGACPCAAHRWCALDSTQGDQWGISEGKSEAASCIPLSALGRQGGGESPILTLRCALSKRKHRTQAQSSPGQAEPHLGLPGAGEPWIPDEVAQDRELCLVLLRFQLQTLPSRWSLVRFPVGKRKTILSGWLKKRPQQGAGKCVSKHGSSRQSGSVGTGPEAAEAPEGLGEGPTAGREVGRPACQPCPGSRCWPRPTRDVSFSPPLEDWEAPTTFCSLCWSLCGELMIAQMCASTTFSA